MRPDTYVYALLSMAGKYHWSKPYATLQRATTADTAALANIRDLRQ
jgi:hypothetical protein